MPLAFVATRLALLGCLLSSGCYLGSARNITAVELANQGGWEVVQGVPEVRQVAREDCGAAALAMVLNYWRFPITSNAIIAVAPPARDRGIAAASLRELARHQGLQAFLIQGRQVDLEREIKRHRPVLVGVVKRYILRNYPHYEVVVGINRQQQRILTLDPAHGLRVNGWGGFATEWAKAGQLALIVFPRAPEGACARQERGS
jgi:ABC-type bacteriocin/lantibiotic exporter with double-glycine peptidase domain